jgi:hypothetical protein
MNTDTAYQDRQEMIHETTDTWEAIEAQLDHWAEMDREYWRQRKEKEYATWLERTYGLDSE